MRFFYPRNGASLTSIIDVTAHRISSCQENEQPKDINGIFIPQEYISIAEPIDAQIDQLRPIRLRVRFFGRWSPGLLNEVRGIV